MFFLKKIIKKSPTFLTSNNPKDGGDVDGGGVFFSTKNPPTKVFTKTSRRITRS